jgi:hypothetical protein
MSCPHIVHYLIPSIALIFGAVLLLMGISTGAWIFYAIGGVVTLLAGWGFNAAYRYIQRQESEPPAHLSHITVITDTGALKIEQNPLQKVTSEDPTPPVV